MPTVRTVNIAANVLWRWAKSSTSERYIAICDELNLVLEADSEEELQGLIPEAMHLLMTDLLVDNEINQYLREKGWQARNLPDRLDGDIKFDVPFELIAEGARIGSSRSAH